MSSINDDQLMGKIKTIKDLKITPPFFAKNNFVKQ